MINPTVCRMVLFSPAEDDYELSAARAPFAAIIADVNEESGTVNLCVIGKHGSTHARAFVPLVQGGVPPLGRAFCTWMDYQRGQAAKSDELVTALTARIEALEAAEANRVAAVKDVFMGMPAGGGNVGVATSALGPYDIKV